MHELDNPKNVILFNPSNKTDQSIPVSKTGTGSYVIDLTETQSKPPSNSIIFSGDNNYRQFITTAQSIIEINKGPEIRLDELPHATSDTGDIAVEVGDIYLPEAISQGRYKGIEVNEKGAIVWQGRDKVVITSIHAPVHPITGESFEVPQTANTALSQTASNNILQFQKPQNQFSETPVPQIGGGNVDLQSEHDSGLYENPYLTNLKKVA